MNPPSTPPGPSGGADKHKGPNWTPCERVVAFLAREHAVRHLGISRHDEPALYTAAKAFFDDTIVKTLAWGVWKPPRKGAVKGPRTPEDSKRLRTARTIVAKGRHALNDFRRVLHVFQRKWNGNGSEGDSEPTYVEHIPPGVSLAAWWDESVLECKAALKPHVPDGVLDAFRLVCPDSPLFRLCKTTNTLAAFDEDARAFFTARLGKGFHINPQLRGNEDTNARALVVRERPVAAQRAVQQQQRRGEPARRDDVGDDDGAGNDSGGDQIDSDPGSGLLESVVGNASPPAFFERTWGRPEVRSWSMLAEGGDDAAFVRLRRGFCDGDVREVIARCRKEDNRGYTAEETSAMADDLENAGRTLNLPFCFTKGATRLRDEVAKLAYNEAQGLHFVNDVEVGVYFSSCAKGDEAGWHYDNNHNITIQLFGVKDWHTMPSGNLNAMSSRAMNDPPRNAQEQRDHVPSTATATVTRLTPGSVIYVPAGTWHRVVPVSDEPACMSVDIRVASATKARWMCEELFARLTEKVYGPSRSGRNRPDHTVSHSGLELFAGNGCETHDAFAKEFYANEGRWSLGNVQTFILKCLPSEPELSDGLELGASLEYLVDSVDDARKAVFEDLEAPNSLGQTPTSYEVNSMVALTKKTFPGAGGGILLNVRATSGLTNMEYLRFSILCPVETDGLISYLIDERRVSRPFPRPFSSGSESVRDLLRVLAFARILTPRYDDATMTTLAAAVASTAAVGENATAQQNRGQKRVRRQR